MDPQDRNYHNKLNDFVKEHFENLSNPNILEFGVRKGISTSLFLDVCKKKSGKLYSIDIEDYSNLFHENSWKFIQTRDDNFEYVEEQIPEKFDIIFLDSFHEAFHVKKIFYHYYKKLKVNGIFIIDDISWFPYTKKNYRDNFNCEVNNKETFNILLKIIHTNHENIDAYFSFKDSGFCKMIKKNNNELNNIKQIPSRIYSIKNLIRVFLRKLKSVLS